jgi:hypothetical protein
MRTELDNLRAAVNWALDATEPDDVGCGLRIIGWLANAANTEMTSGVGVWAMNAIPLVDETTPGIRTATLGAAAFQATFSGDFNRAIELAQQALLDGIPPNCPAPALPYTAWAVSLMSDQSVAFAVMLDALDRLAAADASDYDVAQAHTIASVTGALSQNLPAARAHADQAVRTAHRSQKPSSLTLAQYALGQALVDSDPAAALVAYEEGVALTRRGASSNVLRLGLAHIACVRAAAGDVAAATAALREAVIHACDAGYRPIVVGALDRCVHAFASLEFNEQAAVLAGVVIEGPLADLNYLRGSTAAERRVALDRVRNRLGEAQYNRAVQYGSNLSYEEVVLYARQLFDDQQPRLEATP